MLAGDFVPGQFDDAGEPGFALRNHNALFDQKLHKVIPAKLWEMRTKPAILGDEENSEESDEEDSDFDDDLEFYNEPQRGPNCQTKNITRESVEELSRKFSGKISVDKYDGNGLLSEAANKLISSSKKSTANRLKVKDKQDRATVEQVMDPKTRMILYKLLSSGKLISIDGCISTGKEANVYHATGPDNTAYAIKIYKTSILTFKARDKYVSGEFRFRGGYSKKNPRKMVRLWAEKEYRNLLRIHACGTLLVPQPRLLKSHVLLMDFIGNEGWPSPLLKDVKFDKLEFTDSNEGGDTVIGNKEYEVKEENQLVELLAKLYRDCLVILYKLYKHCRLVHADFSEFNLILRDYKDLYVIDVSQSVEHDHPRSFDFLRSDIKNVQEFFGKRHVRIGDYKEIFDWITSPTIDDTNYEALLDELLKNSKNFNEFNVAEEVFRQSYIPKKMTEIDNFERDYDKAKDGKEELIYTTLLGMKSDLSGPAEKKHNYNSVRFEDEGRNESSEAEESETDSAESGSSEKDEEGDGESKFKDSARPRHETAEEKKERKKAVKDQKAEKRQTKMKKHVKRRKEKMTHANSKK